jgi:RNA polymerase sigma-70 factor (ECF subfamily)
MTGLDRAIIRKALQERDGRAFDALLAHYGKGVRRHIARIVRDEAADDDLSQQVFLRVWTRAEQWKGQGPFEAWLYRIATNLALNHLRTVRRRKEHPLEVQPPPAPLEEDPRHPEDEESRAPGWMIDDSALGGPTDRAERLSRLKETLSEEQREALRLVIEEDMGIKDAADALGVPEGTLKSRLYYAKKRLTHEWEKESEKE